MDFVSTKPAHEPPHSPSGQRIPGASLTPSYQLSLPSTSTMTTIQTLPDHLTQLLSSKGQLGLTFAEIAEKIDKPEVWTAAVFYGQAVPDEATAQKLLDILRIGSAVEMNALLGKTTGVRGMVERGAGWECPPKDPVLYRLYEVLVVYGHSYKALIAEKFGDGIMSAIDFRTSLVRKPDPKGDRVVITLDGKFLPYSPPEAWKE